MSWREVKKKWEDNVPRQFSHAHQVVNQGDDVVRSECAGAPGWLKNAVLEFVIVLVQL
jgi:hypothetical protein